MLLTQENERLEIYILPKGLTLDLLPIIVFAIIWNGFLCKYSLLRINLKRKKRSKYQGQNYLYIGALPIASYLSQLSN